MAIRWRLTLWFSLILLVILLFSGFVLNMLLQRYLYNDVDDNLHVYTARVHGTLHTNVSSPVDFSTIHSSLPPINEFSSPSIYLQIIDANGTVLVRSDNLVNQQLPVSPSLIQNGIGGITDIQTVAAGEGAEVRIMVTPLYLNDQTLVLEVAQSLKPVHDALDQFRLALIGGSLVALFLTIVLGALIVRRTLAPVERITRTAEGIAGSSDLDRRVAYRGPDDEIGRLATTFDRMIERLNRAFESQKYFVADASHELRTPLTVMQGNLDLLKRNMGAESRQESLRAFETETKRMTKIVNDLLLLAEVEAGQAHRLAQVPLREIVVEEINRVRPLAGNRQITLASGDEVHMEGDPDKLRQLVGNLVDNAVKYTADTGMITVSLCHDGAFVRVQVADDGIGIAPENLPHLFDRFYRVDKSRSRARGGTGLGLAIVKGIAEQHGGKVDVESAPSQGARFTVLLKL